MSSNVRTQPDTGQPRNWVADGKKPFTRLRSTNRRRRIPHLLLGTLLVLACTGGFGVVTLNSGNRMPVLALARPVSMGQVLTAQDLRQVNVAVEPGVPVVDAGQASGVVGKTMSTNLPAGTVLSPGMLTEGWAPPAGQAIAALSLKAGQFPPEISPGAHVLALFVPGQAGSAQVTSPSPDGSTAWPAVVVGVTSPPNEQSMVVSVQLPEVVARQVASVPAGQLSLVMLSTGGGRRCWWLCCR
ncbi:hypothetical protein FNH05_13685 [Amycolatopsis rhizosphaerae]|uniref:SAF domain-containing protein n=1 Tax=Amycolatopsis rhizosphaerae TaxID=2053003 RepID=A0A558CTC4_9PSEU|nr:SAF domain-containing protein [Amycolatopsis rhizosphaerae]TVT52019.1 hypothetical protein FNH05_13685 [Amycolatopsis rhizosphaerae]